MTMGLMKKVRENTAGRDARRSWEEGHTVFVMATANGIQMSSGSSLSSVAEQIEAVEEAGWRLDQSAYVFDSSGLGNTLRGVHTFRRATAETQEIKAQV
jgi:hypothetical protein